MTRYGHSLVELIVAMTVLGVGLAAVGAAGVVAMRRTDDALLREQAVALAVATLDSLTQLGAPAAGSVHGPALRAWWSVRAAPRGGEIDLTVTPSGAPRWLRRFRARFLDPMPTLPP